MCAIGGEKYEDMLDYRLKQLEKSKKPAREASSFYIVWSNIEKEETRYSSFESIPIDIRNDEKNFEIIKICYERQKRRTQNSGMFAPKIIERSGYSYFEKLLYNQLIKRGYKEKRDFRHLFPIESLKFQIEYLKSENLSLYCSNFKSFVDLSDELINFQAVKIQS